MDSGSRSIQSLFSLTINSGVTLTIQPGTTIYLASGANLTVASGGRLLAEGTPTSPITFTRAPGTAASWGGIVVNGAAGSPGKRVSLTLTWNSMVPLASIPPAELSF